MRLLAFAAGIILISSQVFGQTSESLRSPKTFGFNLGLGYRGSSFFESGVSGSWFLNANSQVNFSLASTSASINEKFDGEVGGRQLYYVGITTEGKGSAFSVTYKQFFSDTFYVEGGLDYARVRGEFKISKDILFSTEDNISDLGSYRKLSAVIQIGNQWQWEYFNLGTSWVGLLIPVSHSEDFKELENFSERPNSVETFQKDAKETQVSFLRFSIGWAF